MSFRQPNANGSDDALRCWTPMRGRGAPLTLLKTESQPFES